MTILSFSAGFRMSPPTLFISLEPFSTFQEMVWTDHFLLKGMADTSPRRRGPCWDPLDPKLTDPHGERLPLEMNPMGSETGASSGWFRSASVGLGALGLGRICTQPGFRRPYPNHSPMSPCFERLNFRRVDDLFAWSKTISRLSV